MKWWMVACVALAFSAAPMTNDELLAQRAFGVKGGPTLASADIEDLDGTFDSDNRLGWGVGAFLTLGGGLLSIQPELNLLELGFEPNVAPGFSPDVRLRYLAPAVLLRLGLPLAVVRPGILAGVGVGLELNCEIDGVACEDTALQFETGASDPSAVFGADVDLALPGRVALRGDVRYVIGLADIEEASDIWTEVRNRAWQVQAGIAYRF